MQFAHSLLAFSHFLHYAQANWALLVLIFQVGGFVYILGPCGSLQWTLLWVWEFLPLPHPPQVFSVRGFWGFISQCWNPELPCLSCSPVVPPSLSSCKCGATRSASCHLTHCSPPAAPLPRVLFTPATHLLPTSLDKWFFFNSLVVRLLYSSIFWQFWLFFVFKFVVVLVLVVQGGRVYLPTPPSWPEISGRLKSDWKIVKTSNVI